MKTLIPILFAIILIFSCKKDPCYICRTITYSKYDDRELAYDSEYVCDMDEMEILDYQIDRYNFDDPLTYTTCECTEE